MNCERRIFFFFYFAQLIYLTNQNKIMLKCENVRSWLDWMRTETLMLNVLFFFLSLLYFNERMPASDETYSVGDSELKSMHKRAILQLNQYSIYTNWGIEYICIATSELDTVFSYIRHLNRCIKESAFMYISMHCCHYLPHALPPLRSFSSKRTLASSLHRQEICHVIFLLPCYLFQF
jgi:hypothetical protein